MVVGRLKSDLWKSFSSFANAGTTGTGLATELSARSPRPVSWDYLGSAVSSVSPFFQKNSGNFFCAGQTSSSVSA